MQTYYVVRQGWNAANQSSCGRPANPKNNFESGLWKLVGIVQDECADYAIQQVNATCYSGQFFICATHPRQMKGLTEAIRQFEELEALA